MTSSRYLTARCPTGCENWLYPAAVEPHVDLGQCGGRPWTEDIPDATLVAAPMAEVLERLLPPALVAHPDFSYDRLTASTFPDYLRIAVCRGITVRSPIAVVPSRRWVSVALAAAARYGEPGVRRAMIGSGFAELEHELIDPAEFAECPDCHEVVKRKGLKTHQSRNVGCRWQHAANVVRELWQQGWQDPYSVAGAPLKWSDLRAKGEWRRRLQTVEFPKCTAVLLAPVYPKSAAS